MKFLIKTVSLFILLFSLSANAQKSNVAEYFEDGNVSVNKKTIKLGHNPFKGETSFSFEHGLRTLGAIEGGFGLINTEKINNVRYYDTFKLPITILQKKVIYNFWIEPKVYLNENFNTFYVSTFFGITKMSPELLKDWVLNFGYKQRILSNLSIELQSGIGTRFYTRTFYIATDPYTDIFSSIIFPISLKIGYSF